MSQFPPSEPGGPPMPPDEPYRPPHDDGLPGAFGGIETRPVQHHLRPRSAFTPFAWIAIVAMTLLMIVLNMLPMPGGDPNDNSLAESMMELQAKLFVGLGDMQRQMNPNAPPPASLAQLETLNVGPVSQRDRYIILVAEMVGPEQAALELEQLNLTIDAVQRKREASGNPVPVMDEDTERAHSIVQHLYMGAADDDDYDLLARIDQLTDDDKEFLRKEYGWFGELALVPPNTSDTQARQQVLSGLGVKAMVITIGGLGIAGIGVLGFIGLVIMLVLALTGRLKGGIEPTTVHTGVYAETFALWLIVFFGLQAALSAVAMLANLGITGLMAINVFAFFASLIVLAWPVIRGARWSDVRRDIGLTLGRNPVAEPLLGVAGYAMGLPLLGIGLIITLVLMAVSSMFGAAPMDELAPAGGPAHPIAGEIANAGVAAKLLILCLASVAAPIVEEIMFRGVLYRHLRASSRTLGFVGSVIMGTLVNSFIFAAIHPQGLVAVPALMGLAVTFTLLREWRGTLIPSMVVHAVSNGIVMSMLFLMM